jgi:predicted Zn-dependent peptidase
MRLAALSLLLAACRQGLPGPVMPLTPTPDASFRAAPPALDPPNFTARSPLRQERLENGMTVIVSERPELPVASIVYASRGARDGGSHLVGLAGLTARALNEGTRLSDGRELARLRFGGARPDFNVNFAGTTIGVEALATAAAPGIALLGDLVRHPLLTTSGISSARMELTDQAYGRSLQVRQHLRRAAYAELTGSPEPKGRLGDLTDVMVKQFYRERYAPSDSALVVVGAVQTDDVLSAARAAFGGWVGGVSAKPEPEIPTTAGRESAGRERTRMIRALVGDGRQAHFALALPCVRASHRDVVSFEIAALVLANLFGSRVMNALRHEDGVSYRIRAECEQRARQGVFWIEFSSATSAAGEALAKVTAEIRRLRVENVTERELEVAKARHLGDVEGKLASTAEFAGALAARFLAGLDLDQHESLQSDLARLSPDSLRRVLHGTFDETQMGVAVYGDQDALSTNLARFGYLDWSRPEPD